jgi:hypothetical protein
VTLDPYHHRRPRELAQPLNWRAELASLATGCAWIGGMMLVWWVAVHVVS